MTPTQHTPPWIRAAAFVLLLVMSVLLGVMPGRAEAQNAANSKFDHFKTGFPLSGAHATQRCESCHTNGIFKGTPRDCQTCHTQGSRQAKSNVVIPPTHIPTNSSTQGCDSCHGTQSFSNARFSHTTGIPPGTSCQTCHDGVRAQGKSGNHIATRAACDSCHTTRNWNGAKPDHSSFNSSTNCASCHNGSAASGKTANHIPVTANCFSCHSVNGWKPTSWNHAQAQAQVTGACSTCHSGSFPPADGKTANHIPYQSLAGVSISNCDSCHKGGFSSWNPGRFHANVSIVGQCASCHLTPTFGLTSKPNTATHSGITGSCESCHATSGWAGAKVDHSLFNASTQCGTCHNGSTATGKPSKHIPTTENCFSCHSTTGWTPTKWSHPQGGGQCATCHNGNSASGKPGSHIPVTADCASCHEPKGWTPSKWNHTQVNVAGACANCHTGTFGRADGKPRDHIPDQTLTGAAINNCDSCHKGGYSSWNPGRFHNNVPISSQCASCHLLPTYGLTSKPSNSTHATVSGNCESCHNTSGWAGAKVDHSLFNTSTQCGTCHNGSTAMGKPSTHIPTSENCFSCHSTTGWTPTKWNHPQGGGQCATCHNGKAATGKSGSHIPVSVDCASCHEPKGWTPNKWNHTQVNVASACASCHTGTFGRADGKPRDHIPYQTLTGAAINNCDTCHKNGYSSWNPGRFHNNVPISGQCASCHLLPTYGLTSKPSNSTHATVTGNCESCHNTSGWAAAKVNHSLFTPATNCTNCHNGGTATGKPGSHIPVSANCGTCHGTSAWTPTTWNHSLVNAANNCSTCHTGTFPPADGKPGNHIPYQNVSGLAITNCDTCHRGGTKSWYPGAFHTNVSVVGQCATCHGGGILGPTPRPGNHIPYQSLLGVAISNCDTCHKSGVSSWNPGRFHSNVSISNQCASCHLTTAYGLTGKPSTSTHLTVTGNCENCHNTSGWANAVVNHNQFNATTQCGSCHNGNTATGKTSKHIPVSINCFECHNTSGWTPTKWTHNQVIVSNCASCHTGGYQGPDGRPGNHIPYQSVPGLVAPNCDTCHKNGYTKWNPGRLHASVSVVGQCATCHTGTYLGPNGRPQNHIPYQMLTGAAITNCDTCHKTGVSSWIPGRFHSNVSMSSQCSTCHLTSAYGLTGKPLTATHTGVSGNCESCHKSTASWTSNVSYTHALSNAVGTGTCDNCHNGSTATGRPGNHIPILVGGVKCDSCHKSQQRWATNVTMNHTAVISTQLCKSCHITAYIGAGALAKPNNHIPYESQLLNGSTLDCKSCHTNNNAGGFGTAVMNHNGTRGGGTGGTCYGCHNAGTAYLGNMERKSLTHRRSGATDCSQSGCHRPIGSIGVDYRKWD